MPTARRTETTNSVLLVLYLGGPRSPSISCILNHTVDCLYMVQYQPWTMERRQRGVDVGSCMHNYVAIQETASHLGGIRPCSSLVGINPGNISKFGRPPPPVTHNPVFRVVPPRSTFQQGSHPNRIEQVEKGTSSTQPLLCILDHQ